MKWMGVTIVMSFFELKIMQTICTIAPAPTLTGKFYIGSFYFLGNTKWLCVTCRIIALMSPEDSWVAKWQRISKNSLPLYFFLTWFQYVLIAFCLSVIPQTEKSKAAMLFLCLEGCLTILLGKWNLGESRTARETQVHVPKSLYCFE